MPQSVSRVRRVSTFAQTGAAGSGNNSRMGYYRFMMYGDDHQRAEDLGSMDIAKSFRSR